MTQPAKKAEKASSKEDSKPSEISKELTKVLNDLKEKIDALASPDKDKKKEDSNPLQEKLDKGSEVLRRILDGSLPKEKLDAMTYDELLIAIDLKDNMKSSETLPPAPKGKTDTDKSSVYSWEKADLSELLGGS